jgi:hydrogenase/urease accessory protein HupE
MSRRALSWIAVLAFLGAATRVEAHAVFSTRGPFIGGVKHFFLSLDDVLAALALGLVASQNISKSANKVFWGMPCAWLLAGMAGLIVNRPLSSGEILSAGSLLVGGVLAALSLTLSGRMALLLAALMGALHGFLNGVAMQPATFGAGVSQLLGIGACVAFVAIYPATLLEIFKQPWLRIVARVLGSWIAATGLLLIGWTLRLKR